MRIRAYCEEDLTQVLAVFAASVHGLAAAQYDDAQRAAWAPEDIDVSGWRERLRGLTTLIAKGQDMLGFLAYRSDGYIDLLYVAPQAARTGVASALYVQAEMQLLSAGVQDVSVEASLVAAPFFSRHGFVVVEEQCVSRRGVMFRRYLMNKKISQSSTDAHAS